MLCLMSSHLQVYPRDANNNPAVGFPDVSFDDNVTQAALQQDGSKMEVNYIPAAAGPLTVCVNYTTLGMRPCCCLKPEFITAIV